MLFGYIPKDEEAVVPLLMLSRPLKHQLPLPFLKKDLLLGVRGKPKIF